MISNTQKEFRCKHCDAKLLVPRELPPTTGPCPRCGGVITSPEIDPISPSRLASVPALSAMPDEASAESRRLPAQRGKTPDPKPKKQVPVSLSQIDDRVPDVPEAPEVPDEVEVPYAELEGGRSLRPLIWVFLILTVAGGVTVYFASKELKKAAKAPPVGEEIIVDPAIQEANYRRIGWQKDAYQLLERYVNASTVEERIPWVIGGQTAAPQLGKFYSDGVAVDADAPAGGFAPYDLSEEDQKRGFFMMVYDQPPQFKMKEFFMPLANLEVQYGVDEADLLLSTVSRAGNFSMEPLRVHAFFLRTPEGLKLDWEIFTQTKYRTLRSFVELPAVGQVGTFRVLIVEDVPSQGEAVEGSRTYRIEDPANVSDSARIQVRVDSEVGRALSRINWRGTKDKKPLAETATLELKWLGEGDRLVLSIHRFICWEFLGLGGQAEAAAVD